MESDSIPQVASLNLQDMPLHANDRQINTSDDVQPSPTRLMADDEEHPEGDAIREQVEYYFSDENLPHDAYLLGLTGGHQNLPVSVSRICGFKKMRQYKPPTLVRASLKKSTFIEFTDPKHIRRRVPLSIAPTVEPEVIENQAKNQRAPPDQPWLTKGMVGCSATAIKRRMLIYCSSSQQASRRTMPTLQSLRNNTPLIESCTMTRYRL